MSTIRVLLAVGSVAICGVAITAAEGCSQPGVIETNPAPGFGKDGGSKVTVKKDGGTAASADPATDGSDNTDTGDTGDSDTTDDTTTAPAKLDGGAKPGTGTKTDSGATPVTGKDAGVDSTGDGKADAGGGATAKLPPCPSGWSCSDPKKALTDMGIDGNVTDADGNAISAACGNGGAVTCDPKDPKGSCKDLSDPFCAHVSISSLGVDLYSCAQKCDL